MNIPPCEDCAVGRLRSGLPGNYPPRRCRVKAADSEGTGQRLEHRSFLSFLVAPRTCLRGLGARYTHAAYSISHGAFEHLSYFNKG